MAVKKETTEVRKEQIMRAAIDIMGSDGLHGFTTAMAAGRDVLDVRQHDPTPCGGSSAVLNTPGREWQKALARQ